MTSRRTLLLGAAGSVLGARLLSGCDTATETSSTPSAVSPLLTTTTAAPSSTSPAPTTSPPPTTTTTAAASTAWQGADFGPLDSLVERTNGEAFAVWEDGATIHDWYRTDASYTRDIASSQKSVLSLLVGRAVGDGLVALDTPIDDMLGGRWTPSGQSAGITVEHLLAMSSGLDDRREVVAPPGESWIYSGAFDALFDVLTTITGRELNEVAQEWLFGPAGASNSVFYDRPTGVATPIGLRSTVPDLLGIGQLVLDGGPPGLAAGWLDQSFAASQAFNRSYGLLWWLNGQASFMLPGRDVLFPGMVVPTAPASLVAALGKDDQKLYIVPEHRLVVARLGGRAAPSSEAARSPFDEDLWQLLSALRGG